MNARANQVWDFHEPPDHRLDEPNIYFSQSPSFHIPFMNVGLKTKPDQVSSGFPAIPTGSLGRKQTCMLGKTYYVHVFDIYAFIFISL